MSEQHPKEPDPVDAVAGFLVEGHSNIHIIEYLETKDLTPEAAAGILEQALYKFVKISKLPREVRRGWCIEAMRHLYQKMESTGDYAGARQALSEIAKLTDLYPRKGSGSQSTEETKDEIDLYIEEMMSL